jgi:hypothetical protein
MFENKKQVKINDLNEGDFVKFSFSTGLTLKQFLENDAEEDIIKYSQSYADENMSKYILGEYDSHPDYNKMCDDYFFQQIYDKLTNMKNNNEKIEIVKTEILKVENKSTFRQTIQEYFKENNVIDCNAEFV